MPREPIPTWYFALAVVRRGDRFLLVHEHKHGQLWYLPAGRAEPGEDLAAAACRETLEEAGISIRVTGIIRVEHSPRPGSTRVRVIFAGEPIDDAEPKSIPDEESLGAAWVTLDELSRYPLRGQEVEEMLRYVASGGPVYPLDLLQREGMQYLVSQQ
jgi:8-oxo-dGTP pyrophosphatase MutT (NUDIX family)